MKNRLFSLYFTLSTYTLLALTSIALVGAESHQIPKYLTFQETLQENVLLFQADNNNAKPEKYVVKGYSDKDKIVAELVASSIGRKSNMRTPYVQLVPQDIIFEVSQEKHDVHYLTKTVQKSSPIPLEPILTIHPYIEGKTLTEDNPLDISIQHLQKPKHLNNITHHEDLAKILGFNIFISDQDCHRGNVLKQQLNDLTTCYWNIDTDYSFDSARDELKDKWGKNLEELTNNTPQQDIDLVKSSLQETGFAYTSRQYLSTLKTTDISEQHKKALRITHATLQELVQKVPVATHYQLWYEAAQLTDWELNEAQKSIFTEMISANHNNVHKLSQELDRLLI